MKTVNHLKNFEKEYLSEVNNFSVSVENFLNIGVKKEVFAMEKFLRNIYGDSISNEKDDFDTRKKKTISKINESDWKNGNVLDLVIDEIQNKEFDKKLEELIDDLGE